MNSLSQLQWKSYRNISKTAEHDVGFCLIGIDYTKVFRKEKNFELQINIVEEL